jgi:hypothetical protein
MAEATKTEDIELDEDSQPKRNFRRTLEDKANTAESQLAEALAELDGLKRTEAFRSAGINPNDTRQAYFVKGYDGEVDPESIRVAAVEAGFLTEGEQTQQFGTPEVVAAPNTGEAITLHQELAAQQRIAQAGVQAQPVAPPDLAEQIRATTSEVELKALMRSHGYEFDVQD